MTRRWKTWLDPHATVADVLGPDNALAKLNAQVQAHAAHAADQSQQRQDARDLGVYLDTEAGLVITGQGHKRQTLPVATITAATVDSEPNRLTGGLRIGPVGFIGQRIPTYLTITSTGPVWSIPIKPKYTAQARALAARVLTAAHAAQQSE